MNYYNVLQYFKLLKQDRIFSLREGKGKQVDNFHTKKSKLVKTTFRKEAYATIIPP